MVANHAHRILISNDQGKLTNVITQSRVVNYLLPSLESPSKANKSLKELKIGFKDVVSINKKAMAFHAFKLMKEKKVSAVAVVDDHGRIVGNISVNDIKLLGYRLQYFNILSMSCEEYLKEISENPEMEETRTQIYKKFQGLNPHYVISCQSTDSLATAIKMLSFFQVHRLYIVEGGKPVGVISLYDVLAELIKEFS